QNAILTRDWASYPILTMPEAPKVEVELINRPNERPLGAGGGSQGTAGAAVAHAFANAAGKRIRDPPPNPPRGKAAPTQVEARRKARSEERTVGVGSRGATYFKGGKPWPSTSL